MNGAGTELAFLKFKIACLISNGLGNIADSAKNCFLLYLVLRFAKASNLTENNDPILKKKVPNIVFLQN